MTEENHEMTQDSKEPKAKFREALEKEKQGQGIRNNNNDGGFKISGNQSGGNAPKMFRSKSGSA